MTILKYDEITIEIFWSVHVPVDVGFSSSSSVSESRNEHHFGAGPSDYSETFHHTHLAFLVHIFKGHCYTSAKKPVTHLDKTRARQKQTKHSKKSFQKYQHISSKGHKIQRHWQVAAVSNSNE